MSDRLMQRGKEWLEKLLKLSQVPASVKVEKQDPIVTHHDSEAEAESESYWLTIDESNLTPKQIETLIGSDGSVIDAMQYLANSILNLGKTEGDQASYTIELDGYRVRRQAELLTIAEEAVEKVRQTGQEVELKSLSSAERRQVHTFLKDYEDLETYSRGQEPDRRLVIKLR